MLGAFWWWVERFAPATDPSGCVSRGNIEDSCSGECGGTAGELTVGKKGRAVVLGVREQR